MKAITLRNIPPELARVIQHRAHEQRSSINRTVIRILEEALGVMKKKEKAEYHDLDWLAGAWSKERAEEFEKSLAEQRQIEPELWS